jgi:ABC-type glycerol-3-phosphate transport system substrate-binding protein
LHPQYVNERGNLFVKPGKTHYLTIAVLVLVFLASAWWVFRVDRPHRGDGRRTIQLAHWQIEGNVREAVQAQLDRYEELNPDVSVEQVAVPGSVYQMWLRTRLSGGLGTDIVEFGIFLPGMKDIPPRYFQPITRYVDLPNPYNKGTRLEGVPWRETFRDGMRSVDGYHSDLNQYYAATLWMNSVRMFYNKSLLKGVTGYDKPPPDFRGFRSMSEQITEASRNTGRSLVPIAGGKHNSASIMGFMFSRLMMPLMYELDRHHKMKVLVHDTAFGYLEGRWSFDSPEVRAGLELIREMGGLMRPGFLQLSRDDALQQFIRGEAVMMGAGTWDAPSIREMAPFEVGVARMPFPDRDDPDYGHLVIGPVGDGRVRTGFPLYVNKRTPHLDQVIDLLHFMTSMEGSRIFSAVSGSYPATVGVEPGDPNPDSAPFFDGYATGGLLNSPAGPEARRLWDTHLHLLFGPFGSPERIADALRETFSEAIRTDMNNELKQAVHQLRRLEPGIVAQIALEGFKSPDEIGEAAISRQLQSGQNTYEIRTFELRNDLISVGVDPYF